MLPNSPNMLVAGLVALGGLFPVPTQAESSSEDLILCDCGIGDNKDHAGWSTSRQMNWYKSIKWPDSAYAYPNAPDMAVEIPYDNGKYPWIPDGATGTFSNGDVWTAYIEDGTPDGFKAGNAVSSTNGRQMLNCWAYRGRPVSAAINTTITQDAICWTAFVCNHDNSPPPRPKDMGSPTSTLTTSSAAPATSVFSETPTPPTSTGSGGQPEPTSNPDEGKLLVAASVNPRFLNWQNTWQTFINSFVWDQTTGRCVGPPIRGVGYNITVECAGVQIDEDSHMTLLLIEALRDVGLHSLWFNQNPPIPGGTSANATTQHWVVMPEAFTFQATDAAKQNVVGYLSYKTEYDGFLTGPCSSCDPHRFDESFFDPIIAAMQGSYPVYNSYAVQAQCNPWLVC